MADAALSRLSRLERPKSFGAVPDNMMIAGGKESSGLLAGNVDQTFVSARGLRQGVRTCLVVYYCYAEK